MTQTPNYFQEKKRNKQKLLNLAMRGNNMSDGLFMWGNKYFQGAVSSNRDAHSFRLGKRQRENTTQFPSSPKTPDPSILT